MIRMIKHFLKTSSNCLNLTRAWANNLEEIRAIFIVTSYNCVRVGQNRRFFPNFFGALEKIYVQKVV